AFPTWIHFFSVIEKFQPNPAKRPKNTQCQSLINSLLSLSNPALKRDLPDVGLGIFIDGKDIN
ncbi:MAG: hypothetical protein ACRECY_17300, partial [Phyllobacterium sp.]